MTICLLDQILNEMDKLDREKISQNAASRLCYMISNSTPKEIAQEIANSAALYSIFDGMLDRISTISKLASLVELLEEASALVNKKDDPLFTLGKDKNIN